MKEKVTGVVSAILTSVQENGRFKCTVRVLPDRVVSKAFFVGYETSLEMRHQHAAGLMLESLGSGVEHLCIMRSAELPKKSRANRTDWVHFVG